MAKRRTDSRQAVTAATGHLVDLRILTCLITASWPAARDLVKPSSRAALLDQHIRRQRRQMSSVRASGRTVWELSFYDTPPLDAAVGAVVLATADRIASTGDVDGVRDVLHPLVARAPAGMPNWTNNSWPVPATARRVCKPHSAWRSATPT